MMRRKLAGTHSKGVCVRERAAEKVTDPEDFLCFDKKNSGARGRHLCAGAASSDRRQGGDKPRWPRAHMSGWINLVAGLE